MSHTTPTLPVKPNPSVNGSFFTTSTGKKGKNKILEDMQEQTMLAEDKSTQNQEEAQKSSSKATMRMLSADETLRNAKLDSVQTSKLLEDQLNLDQLLSALKVPKQAQAQVKELLSNPEKLAQALKGFKMPSIPADSKTLKAGQALSKKAVEDPEGTLKSLGITIDSKTLQKTTKDLMEILQMAFKALADALVVTSKASNQLATLDQVQQKDHVKYLQSILADITKTGSKAVADAKKAKFWDTFKKVASAVAGGLMLFIGAVLCCIPGAEVFGVALLLAGVVTIGMGCFGDAISKGIDNACDKIQNPKLREAAKIAAKATIAILVTLAAVALIIATGGTATPIVVAAAAAGIGSLVGTFAGLGGTSDSLELYNDIKYNTDMENTALGASKTKEVQKEQKIMNDIVLAITIVSAVISLGASLSSLSSVGSALKNIGSAMKNAGSALKNSFSVIDESALSIALQEALADFAQDLGSAGSSASKAATSAVSSSENAAANAIKNFFTKVFSKIRPSSLTASTSLSKYATTLYLLSQGSQALEQTAQGSVSFAQARKLEEEAIATLTAGMLQTNFQYSTNALDIGTQMVKQDETSRQAQTTQRVTQEHVREDEMQEAMKQIAALQEQIEA
ncbi:MAG: hypothetical protein K940chlam8_00149 [Chlamydiae bacterium]|nr:hypothetical protein [Chlamydiota bacterium]